MLHYKGRLPNINIPLNFQQIASAGNMGAFSTARPTVTHECKAFLSVFLLVGVFTDIGVHAAAINTAVKAERDLYSTSSIEMNNDNGLQV